MPILDDAFVQELADLGAPYPRLRWYTTAIVALAAMNYPEGIGPLYTHLLEKFIPAGEHAEQTRKIRESLVMATGLHGAAKTGTAMRALYQVTPEHLIETECYRENDVEPAVAMQRGHDFMRSLYRDIPDLLTPDDYVRKTSPDYFYLVSQVFYPTVFSFDQILNKIEASQAMISTLIGNDCALQSKNHMKGIMFNGASREEVTMIRDVVYAIAKKLDVRFKNPEPIAVPEHPNN